MSIVEQAVPMYQGNGGGRWGVKSFLKSGTSKLAPISGNTSLHLSRMQGRGDDKVEEEKKKKTQLLCSLCGLSSIWRHANSVTRAGEAAVRLGWECRSSMPSSSDGESHTRRQCNQAIGTSWADRRDAEWP